MDSRQRINKHTYIPFFCKYILTIHRKHPDPIQTYMFMHTNVYTVRESNPRLAQLASIQTTVPNRSSMYGFVPMNEYLVPVFIFLYPCEYNLTVIN
jgi:hypothetical protein